ncbi:MAG: dTMP kinase [Treponema sp.]|nr:dTMP kinase [Treponema sp.]
MILKNFIVFEGIDGSGTSTQIEILSKKLPSTGVKFHTTFEPTESQIGKFLRTILKGDIKFDNRTLAYLFAADRCEHVFGENGIKKMCSSGTIVISDRYLFSSLAYQSASCGIELPKTLNSFFPLPEILFYFQINPEISLNRVLSRDGKNTEIFENLEYQKKTSSWYEKIIKYYETNKKNSENNMHIVKIDASKSIEEISQIIWTEVSKLPIIKL